jgi:hypothetical protein
VIAKIEQELINKAREYGLTIPLERGKQNSIKHKGRVSNLITEFYNKYKSFITIETFSKKLGISPDTFSKMLNNR